MQTLRAILVLAAAAAGCFAQQWEFGAGVGGSLPINVPVTAPGGSATAGFQDGVAIGAYLGQNLYSHVSGEIHYGFMMSDLCVKSGGAEATFSGQSHVLHYDVVLHTGGRTARKQAFLSIGGGMRVFRGTGTEAQYQPLMQYAYLTKTQELKPMGTVGVGVKAAISAKLLFRAEIRDYITPFPTQVVTPAVNATFGRNILHDFVPMVSLIFGL
ncbi:MAG: hypothetical protein ABSF25_25555 [Bryobacteraceae bacterium]|jgi:hypothetical protein